MAPLPDGVLLVGFVFLVNPCDSFQKVFYYSPPRLLWIYSLCLIWFCSSSMKMRLQPFWARKNVSRHGYLQWRKPRPHTLMRSTKSSSDLLQGGLKKDNRWKEVASTEKFQNQPSLNCKILTPVTRNLRFAAQICHPVNISCLLSYLSFVLSPRFMQFSCNQYTAV